MAERLANLGYFGLVKEATKGTPLTPTDFVPLYEESMNTNGNFVDQTPIFGNKFATYAMVQGQRSHKGDVTILAEPNTTARIADMLLTRTSTTGAGPYTHTYGLSATQNPNSYTVDISTGNVVARYFGVEASKIAPSWNKNELRWKISLSALGSLTNRVVLSVTGAGPYTVNLDTAYDPNPAKGYVVGDLIRFKLANGTTVDATVATVDAAFQFITTVTNPAGVAAGDSLYLRPATPSFTLLNTFLWAKSEFRFGATAAAALTAIQTRVEQGSTFDIIHKFENDEGALRSGGFDPAALIRTVGDVDLTVKKFFDTPDDIANFNQLTKTAAVLRHFAGTTNQYEVRLTFNHLKTDGTVVPDLKSNDITYSDLKYHPVYDTADAQAFQLTVVNNLTTI